LADADDADHFRCSAWLRNCRNKLVVPHYDRLVKFATYSAPTGAEVEASFLESLVIDDTFTIEALTPADYLRAAALARKYADFPLGGSDHDLHLRWSALSPGGHDQVLLEAIPHRGILETEAGEWDYAGVRTLAELAARLGSELADLTFSGVVHVSAGDQTVFARAYGLADRAGGVANTVDTRFGTASVTKLVTALGIGALIDDGRLALDTRLVDALPVPLPGTDPAVTIGRLLNHTSGVYDCYDEEVITDFEAFELPIPPARLLRPSDYLPMLTGPRKFPPGERFSYSNGGYVLLGLVIEELTGSFHDHLERRVLRPCGMNRSGFFRLDDLPPDTAIGYLDDGPATGTATATNAGVLPVVGGPDGGMFATAGDLRKLWHGFLAGRVVSAAMVAAFTTLTARYRDDLGYGYGLWLRDGGDVRHVEGGDAGVSVRSTHYAPMTVVTVMANSTNGAWPVDKLVNRLVREAAGRPSQSAASSAVIFSVQCGSCRPGCHVEAPPRAPARTATSVGEADDSRAGATLGTRAR